MKWPLAQNSITWQDKFNLVKFILTSDKFTNGPCVREFEQQWADWIGSKHALMVSSGSNANTLIIASIKEYYGLKNQDKVLVPACTWVTNIAPVIQANLEPIFCDVNLDNLSFDIEHMNEIAKVHPDIKVIFVTHLLGYSAENELYQKIFPEAIIIDDVCESHGCKSPGGLKRGSDSVASSFSFYFGHHMTTIEGGMVNTNNSDLYDLMRMKRSHGLARESANFNQYTKQFSNIHPQFLFITDGYNLRSTELNAVLGISQLKRLDNIVDRRRKNFQEFVNVIDNYQQKFYPVKWQDGNSNYALPFICRSPEITHNIKKLFEQHQVEHRPIVGGNLLRQPFLQDYTFGTQRISYNVDLLHDNGVYIGNNQYINSMDLKWLANLLEKL